MTNTSTAVDNPPSPFGQAGEELHARGWAPFPLPPRRKAPPPGGKDGETSRTGETGIDASAELVHTWALTHPDHNVATRAPQGVIGIDVDQYGDKQGGRALAAFVEQHNLPRLPRTYVSSSKPPPSGIHWFQIPEGTPKLVGAPVIGVEIIQRHHRYAVMPPSIHDKTGDTYQWTHNEHGEILEAPPEIADLPWLPWVWVEALTAVTIDAEPRTAVEWEPVPGVDMHPRVKAVLDRADFANPGGRHDTMCAAQMALVRYESLGYPGSTHAINELGRAFVLAVLDERDGGPEYASALNTCRAKVAVTTVDIPAYEPPWEPPQPAELGEATPEPKPDTPNLDKPNPYEGLGDWAPIDITKYLVDGWEPEPATLLTRTDGKSLFYRRNVNWLHGASGEGKTWVALIIAVQEILAHRHTLWIHYEDPEADKLVHRLRLLGVNDNDMLEYFHVVTVSSSMEQGMGQIRYVTGIHDVDLVVIDSIGEAIGADGIDVKQDERFTQWIHATARQLAGDGCTVVGIDHLPMGEPSRLDPIGSFRKKAATTGSMFLAEAPQPFSKERPGYIRLTCAKDRSGAFIKGEVGAIIPITPENGKVIHRVKAPENDEEMAQDRDERNMAEAKTKLLKALRMPNVKSTTRSDWARLGGRKEDNLRAVRWAIDIDLLVSVDGADPAARGTLLAPDRAHPVYFEDRPMGASDGDPGTF